MTIRDDRTVLREIAPGLERHHLPLTGRLIDQMRARGFVTAAEAAARSNIPLPTIYGWARDGTLACQMCRKRRLFAELESLERGRSSGAMPASGNPPAADSVGSPVSPPPRLPLRHRTKDPRTVEDMHARGFVTPTEAALLSRTPLPTIYSWVRARALECETQPSGRLFISMASLQKMIAPALVEQRQLLERMRRDGWTDGAVARATAPRPAVARGTRSPWTADLIATMRARGFVTPTEAAELSSIPRVTIYSWLKDGTLEYEVSGRRRL